MTTYNVRRLPTCQLPDITKWVANNISGLACKRQQSKDKDQIIKAQLFDGNEHSNFTLFVARNNCEQENEKPGRNTKSKKKPTVDILTFYIWVMEEHPAFQISSSPSFTTFPTQILCLHFKEWRKNTMELGI